MTNKQPLIQLVLLACHVVITCTESSQSACWRRNTKCRLTAYGAYGARTFAACTELLLRERKYSAAHLDTRAGICFLSTEEWFLEEPNTGVWFATRRCLLADDTIIKITCDAPRDLYPTESPDSNWSHDDSQYENTLNGYNIDSTVELRCTPDYHFLVNDEKLTSRQLVCNTDGNWELPDGTEWNNSERCIHQTSCQYPAHTLVEVSESVWRTQTAGETLAFEETAVLKCDNTLEMFIRDPDQGLVERTENRAEVSCGVDPNSDDQTVGKVSLDLGPGTRTR